MPETPYMHVSKMLALRAGTVHAKRIGTLALSWEG
jgi:hypothetical protein